MAWINSSPGLCPRYVSAHMHICLFHMICVFVVLVCVFVFALVSVCVYVCVGGYVFVNMKNCSNSM